MWLPTALSRSLSSEPTPSRGAHCSPVLPSGLGVRQLPLPSDTPDARLSAVSRHQGSLGHNRENRASASRHEGLGDHRPCRTLLPPPRPGRSAHTTGARPAPLHLQAQEARVEAAPWDAHLSSPDFVPKVGLCRMTDSGISHCHWGRGFALRPGRSGARTVPRPCQAAVQTRTASPRRISPTWRKCGAQRGQAHGRPGRREKARDSGSRLAKPSPGKGEIPTEREALKGPGPPN